MNDQIEAKSEGEPGHPFRGYSGCGSGGREDSRGFFLDNDRSFELKVQ